MFVFKNHFVHSCKRVSSFFFLSVYGKTRTREKCFSLWVFLPSTYRHVIGSCFLKKKQRLRGSQPSAFFQHIILFLFLIFYFNLHLLYFTLFYLFIFILISFLDWALGHVDSYTKYLNLHPSHVWLFIFVLLILLFIFLVFNWIEYLF